MTAHNWIKSIGALLAVLLVAALPVHADSQSSREIVARIFASRPTSSYELRADFSGSFTLALRPVQYKTEMAGSLRESYRVGEGRHREATVSSLQVPMLLKPFARALGTMIEQGMESELEDPRKFENQDTFILDARSGQIHVAGIRRDIVDEAFDRYLPRGDRNDPATRSAIAKWLYTAPSMRDWIQRAGPPYAFFAAVSEDGLLYELVIYYDWGQLGSKISYAHVAGQPVWRQLTSDIAGEAAGIGRFSGRLVVSFTNHCLNCSE